MSDENEKLETRILDLENDNKDLKNIIQMFFNALTSDQIDPRVADKIRSDFSDIFDNTVYLNKEDGRYYLSFRNGFKLNDDFYLTKKDARIFVEMMGLKIIE